MKKIKHEAELVREALQAGITYAEKRRVVEFEPTDSHKEKIEFVYRLLVHDKLIQALPSDQLSQSAMRLKLARWYMKQLPSDHPLLN